MSRTPSSSLEISKPKLVGNLLHKRMTTDLDNGRNRPFSGPPFEKVKKFSKCGSEKGWLSKKTLMVWDFSRGSGSSDFRQREIRAILISEFYRSKDLV